MTSYLINQAGKSFGVRAVGVSGKDGRMIRVKKLLLSDAQDASVQHDIGLVGDVVGVDTAVLDALIEAEFVPVVSPIAADDAGVSHNVNADVAAGEIACAVRAHKLMLLTNIKGVLDKQGELITEIDGARADAAAAVPAARPAGPVALRAGAGRQEPVAGRARAPCAVARHRPHRHRGAGDGRLRPAGFLVAAVAHPAAPGPLPGFPLGLWHAS